MVVFIHFCWTVFHTFRDQWYCVCGSWGRGVGRGWGWGWLWWWGQV